MSKWPKTSNSKIWGAEIPRSWCLYRYVWGGPLCGLVLTKAVQSMVRSRKKWSSPWSGPVDKWSTKMDRTGPFLSPCFLPPPQKIWNMHCQDILKIGLLHYKIFKWSIKLIHITKTSPYLKHLVHIQRFRKGDSSVVHLILLRFFKK